MPLAILADPSVRAAVLRGLAGGLTRNAIAASMGIHARAIQRWAATHPQFKDAMKRAELMAARGVVLADLAVLIERETGVEVLISEPPPPPTSETVRIFPPPPTGEPVPKRALSLAVVTEADELDIADAIDVAGPLEPAVPAPAGKPTTLSRAWCEEKGLPPFDERELMALHWITVHSDDAPFAEKAIAGKALQQYFESKRKLRLREPPVSAPAPVASEQARASERGITRQAIEGVRRAFIGPPPPPPSDSDKASG